MATASNLVGTCLAARGVKAEDAHPWLGKRQLLDYQVIVEAVRQHADDMVQEGLWLFERAALAGD